MLGTENISYHAGHQWPLLLTCMIHEGQGCACHIYCCVSSNMLGAELVVSKYLLSEQMNSLILVPPLGHS